MKEDFIVVDIEVNKEWLKDIKHALETNDTVMINQHLTMFMTIIERCENGEN